jgi:hypothetical protein
MYVLAKTNLSLENPILFQNISKLFSSQRSLEILNNLSSPLHMFTFDFLHKERGKGDRTIEFRPL